MPVDSSRFIAWQQAEQRASAAEKQLFAKLLAVDPGELPTREDVDRTRTLREAANALLQQMLAEMQRDAAHLKAVAAQARETAEQGRRSAGFAGNAEH